MEPTPESRLFNLEERVAALSRVVGRQETAIFEILGIREPARNANKGTFKAGEWKPEVGRFYWHISSGGEPSRRIYRSAGHQKLFEKRLALGNVYPSETTCIQAIDHAAFWRRYNREACERNGWAPYFNGELKFGQLEPASFLRGFATRQAATDFVTREGYDKVMQRLIAGPVFQWVM